jgi:hypothetical protein
MKKIMKKIIPLLLFTLLISCSSDSGSTPSPTQNLKLRNIVYTNLRTPFFETTNFIYSGDVLLRAEGTESTGNTFKTEFNYVNNKLQSEAFYDNGVLSGTATYSYTGELITSMLSNESGGVSTTNYAYNSNNQMINEKQYTNGNIDGGNDYVYNNQGNVSKNLYFSGFTTFEYDTNKNPYSLIYPIALMKIYPLEYSKNNITKEIQSGGTIKIYEFVYNDSGYPTQIIEKENGVSVTKTKFTYN